MGNIGYPEILMILVLGLLMFGPKRLPEIARSVGKALRELRKAADELSDELKAGFDEPTEHPNLKAEREAREPPKPGPR